MATIPYENLVRFDRYDCKPKTISEYLVLALRQVAHEKYLKWLYEHTADIQKKFVAPHGIEPAK